MNAEPNESGDESSKRTWASRHGLLALVIVSLLAPVWLIGPLPIQDLPLHEQIVSLLLHGIEWSGQADRLAVGWEPRPYALVHQLWAGVGWVVGVDSASRLLLSYVVVGGFVSQVVLVRRLDPRKHVRALLVGLFVFSDFYFVGFVPLLFALPTGFWLLSRRMLAPAGGALKGELADAALLLVTFLCHPLAGFLFGLVLIPVCARSATPTRALSRLVLIGLPCVLWTLGIAVFTESRPLVPNLPLYWAPLWQGLLSLLFYPTAPYGWFLFWPLGDPARTLAILSILAWVMGAVSLWPRGERVARERIPGLGISVIGLLGFLLFFPDAWRNGSVLSLRALIVFFPLLLAWLPARVEDRRTTLLTATAVLLSSAVAFGAHAIAAREARPLDAVLARLEPKANVLPPQPLGFHSGAIRGRLADPHLNAVVRYHVRAGGLGPSGGLYVSNTSVRVTRPLPNFPDPRVYRYVLVPRGTLVRPPAGFVELLLESPAWQVFERKPR